MAGMDEDTTIDEGLFNRQLYVIDRESMQHMRRSRVLIYGLDALGVETAKNLCLMGVKEVALLDDRPVSHYDLSGNFYATEADVGKARAAVVQPKLAELNAYVRVSLISSGLDASSLAGFSLVVVSSAPVGELSRVNAACREVGACMVAADCRGLFTRIFCDFGDAHVVSDVDGEEALSYMVESITNDDQGVVLVTDETRHGLQTGDLVTFTEVKGMVGLNGCAPRKVTVLSPYTFSIGSTAELGAHTGGGVVTQVKQGTTLRFLSFDAALAEPGELLVPDTSKWDRPAVMHCAFVALDRFRAAHAGELPLSGHAAHAEEVLAQTRAVAAERRAAGLSHAPESISPADEQAVRWLALTARGVVSPMVATVGGIVAQEAVKGVSHKFMPLRQWMYMDASECLPATPLAEPEYAPAGSRYDGQIAVFGRSLQAAILAQRYFLVGAGAIGCEMLKNWAMMGLGCGEGGHVTVTDMDRIEKSNLSRQFLFRTSNIGQAKATTAAAAAQSMNPGMRVLAMEQRVGADTEHIFHDTFWEQLTGVCNALDNVDARLYVDQRCVFYNKSLLESGTLGTKGNTQVVVPNLTENYGASRDPPEKSIPVCTLKNFPFKIEHTIQWARDWFEGEFAQGMAEANEFLTNRASFLAGLAQRANEQIPTLERVRDTLVTSRATTFDQCVAWARLQFEEVFSNQIRQLLHSFPLDQLTSDGTPFWSGHKRPPAPLRFSADDAAHMAFVVAAANLRAANFGLRGTTDQAVVRAILDTVHVPAFVPREGVKIATTEAEAKEQGGVKAMTTSDQDAAAIVATLPDPSTLAGFRVNPLEFEKDDDTNHHMDLIHALANLRARNYVIAETDRATAKKIAGKIIPAIATTTALVTGLVCLEFYKLLQGKPLEAYRNCYANLALPLFSFSEPMAPQRSGTEPRTFTVWDKAHFDGPLTLGQLVDAIEERFNVDVGVVSCGVAMLVSSFMNPAKARERRATSVEKLAAEVARVTITPNTKYVILEASCSDKETDDDVDIPSIRYRIPDAVA